MIGEMRTEALGKALGREELTNETLIGLLVLALAADNVSIRTHRYVPIQSIGSNCRGRQADLRHGAHP